VKKKTLKLPVAPYRIPLCKPYISKEEEQATRNVFRSGWLMQGPKVAEFESLISEYVGTKYAVAVNSGTSALSLALIAVGLNAGEKVLMPSHSFVATANCVVHRDGEPAFIDIARGYYNIDPSKIESAVDRWAHILIVVHQIGFAADMDPIMSIASRRKLVVIEDAACSLGTTYRGQKTGAFGEAACLSFHPRKVITTGEGGMVLTNSEKIANKAEALRNHGLVITGKLKQPRCEMAGFNYRMTDVQAAIGIAQFRKLEEIIRLRTRLANRYREELSKLEALALPKWPEGSVPNYQSFVVETADNSTNREAILGYMTKAGIECRPGIQPIHEEPAYAKKSIHENLPETVRAADRSFFLPLYPSMTDKEQGIVIESLKKALSKPTDAKEAR
jgi:perosamine synthetase